MQDRFFELVSSVTPLLHGDEIVLAHFVGEQSDFVRYNRGLVRQPMTIRQAHVTLSLVNAGCRTGITLSLSGIPDEDRGRVREALLALRAELADIPEDPYLLYSSEPSQSERIERGTLPEPRTALDTVLSAAKGLDLVGLYASGPMYRGFASSLGHRHWHTVESFQLSFSLYQSADKAVQKSVAGAHFDAVEVARRIEAARGELGELAKPPKRLEPGTYRAYLAPAALAEIVAMLSWGGVSEKAQRTKTSCLQKLLDGSAQLSDEITLAEDTAHGLAPAFDELGFRKPSRIELITRGRHSGAMVSPRTAREYGIPANGAGPEEALQSAELAPGTLPSSDVLRALDTGIYVGNLWYLNFSDRVNARLTGMTRFATFWVEGGKIVAPIDVMRFDDSLYRMFGSSLVGLTREREFLPSTSTYDHRSVHSMHLPGALVGEMSFTL